MSSAGAAEAVLEMGARLREMRKELGLTQAELAAAANLGVRSINRYESGDTAIPADVAMSLRAAGIDLARLFSFARNAIPFDRAVLKDVIEWVDHEWSAAGEPLDDLERQMWIIREYVDAISDRTLLRATAARRRSRAA